MQHLAFFEISQTKRREGRPEYDHLRKRFNNVSIKKFKGMRHEIQNEQCKDELLALMESFISNE